MPCPETQRHFGTAGNRSSNLLITSPTPSPLSHLTPCPLLGIIISLFVLKVYVSCFCTCVLSGVLSQLLTHFLSLLKHLHKLCFPLRTGWQGDNSGEEKPWLTGLFPSHAPSQTILRAPDVITANDCVWGSNVPRRLLCCGEYLLFPHPKKDDRSPLLWLFSSSR